MIIMSVPPFDYTIPPPPLPGGFEAPIAPPNYYNYPPPCYPVHGFTEPPPPYPWPSLQNPPVRHDIFSKPTNSSNFQNTSSKYLENGRKRHAESSNYKGHAESSDYKGHAESSDYKGHAESSYYKDSGRTSMRSDYSDKSSSHSGKSSRRVHHISRTSESRHRRSRSHSRDRYRRRDNHHDDYARRRRSKSRDRREYRSHSRISYRHSTRAGSLESRSRRSSTVSSHRSTYSHSGRNASREPMSDREKIINEYRKNFCNTSKQLLEKVEQWSKENNEVEGEKWCRSSPAELYYKPVPGTRSVEQTPRLKVVCDSFMSNLIERGRKARPETDELPPLKQHKYKVCSHKDDEKESDCSEPEDILNDDGSQGIADRVMLELQRKQSHPRRLHPEMWFNNTGEMNGGLLCRCSASARRYGMRHGVFADEPKFKRCILTQNNIEKLYHYKITVSPPTNFLIQTPTIIAHDEHEFIFSGFSMFSHYKLAELPSCKVIRFNIEYTILYVEEEPPQNFSIQELDLFEEYLFVELLELIDLDLGKPDGDHCSQFHFMPIFIRKLAEGGSEVLSMCEVLKYLVDESKLLIPPNTLDKVHTMDDYTWGKLVDNIKGMIVTYPGKKPCSVRVDQLDRTPPPDFTMKQKLTYFPEIVHFGIRPPQLSYAGNPEYQKAWRYYVKYRHLVANMSKPTHVERQKLAAKEARLQEMRTQSKMKRDVTVAISSQGFYTTGLMCDVVQHGMLIPVLVRHLRFHKSLDALEKKIGYVFSSRALLQTALTHPSYRENFGTNPDHARNSLTNCGIRQPEYGDRKIHYTRKKGIVTLINIMSRFGKRNETESTIKHNERLEFLGDAVVEFLSSIHLFKMFPGLAEGGLATYRASIVQNQHLAQLAKNIGLEQFMLYAHGSDLCWDVAMRHAMANCFEALMGALFLDGGVEVADRVFSLSLWYNEPELLDVWVKERGHPLQEQEPLGDRKHIKNFEFLQRLTKFEESIGVTFKHIRLLARAFTDRSVGFTNLTLGSNQRLEFLGDTVLQLVVSDRLYRRFPEHHEGHLSLLRSSLVNNRTQATVCDDLDMSSYAIYNNPKAKPTTKKHKADLLEAFLGALYIDKNMEYCQTFCEACFFPRLQEFIMNQDWNDPKSKLQQCCLTLRSIEGGEPDIPIYKVIECLGPTNTRVYTVAVYFRGTRLASARGHSIQEAEMNAAEAALSTAHDLFPQLDHQKRVMAKIIKGKKNKDNSAKRKQHHGLSSKHKKLLEEKVPKAYRLDQPVDSSSDESSVILSSPEEDKDESSEDNSEVDNYSDREDYGLADVKVSSLLNDMEKLKEVMIEKNEYDKLKEKSKICSEN